MSPTEPLIVDGEPTGRTLRVADTEKFWGEPDRFVSVKLPLTSGSGFSCMLKTSEKLAADPLPTAENVPSGFATRVGMRWMDSPSTTEASIEKPGTPPPGSGPALTAPIGRSTANATATRRPRNAFMAPSLPVRAVGLGEKSPMAPDSGGPGREVAGDAATGDQPRPELRGTGAPLLAAAVGVAQPVQHLVAPGDVAAGAPQDVVEDLDRRRIRDLVGLAGRALVDVDQMGLQHIEHPDQLLDRLVRALRLRHGLHEVGEPLVRRLRGGDRFPPAAELGQPLAERVGRLGALPDDLAQARLHGVLGNCG